MNNEQLLLIIVNLATGFTATFLAAILWSKTRDASWITFILGTFIYFAGVVIDILDSQGIFIYSIFTIGDVSILKIALSVLPFILFSIGFLLIIRRKNRSVN